jgi:hypothetical protein
LVAAAVGFLLVRVLAQAGHGDDQPRTRPC